MGNDNIEIKVENEIKELVIRKGDAPIIDYPVPRTQVDVSFESLMNFAQKQLEYENIKKEETLAIISIDEGKITFNTNQRSKYNDVISARLLLSDYISRFRINDTKGFNQKELSDIIKFNRRFISHPSWEDLYTKTKNISVNQIKDLQNNIKDNRGNMNVSLEVKNSMDYPEMIRLNFPVFKHDIEPQNIEVDTVVDLVENQVRFWLQSPGLEELIESEKEKVLSDYEDQLKTMGVPCLRI